MNESRVVSSEPVRALKSLPQSLNESQIIATLHRFRLESGGNSEVRMGPPGSRSVIVSSTDSVHLEADWQLLRTIVERLASSPRPRRGSREGERVADRAIAGQSSARHRPVEILESPLLSRLSNGSICLLGDAARLLEALDRRFLDFARTEGAEPIACPPIWHGDELPRFGYETSSGNLLTVKRAGDGPNLYWQLAACNNVWLHLAGRQLAGPARFTVRGVCCRGEGGHYFMLERMRSFSMREVTFIGRPAEVLAFRERALAFLAAVTGALGLGGRLSPANDPFFLVDQDAGRPGAEDADGAVSKMELRLGLYDDKSVACASVNVHGSFFAERLDISGPDLGESLWTACVAFGLERWVWAILVQFGPHSERWPTAVRDLIVEP